MNTETKQWMSYSTTQVCSELSEEDKENIENGDHNGSPEEKSAMNV